MLIREVNADVSSVQGSYESVVSWSESVSKSSVGDSNGKFVVEEELEVGEDVVSDRRFKSVCVCVCVCERERAIRNRGKTLVFCQISQSIGI
jgi:hypothetical protein